MLIAQTFCNIHFIYVWNCKNSRCYKKLQLLLDQSRLAVLLILFFFGQKKSFLWQIWQKRLLWLKSILCNHNSVITLLSTHEIIHGSQPSVVLNIFRFVPPVHVHLKTDKVDLKKSHCEKKFFCIFFQSTHHVDMKNGVECYKDFFAISML